jgi:hypothetical protein
MNQDKPHQPFKPGQHQPDWSQKGQQPGKPQGHQPNPGQGGPSNRPPHQGGHKT